MQIKFQYPKSRWIMLILLMLITIVIEMQWLTHAPIARVAEKFYGDQIHYYPWLTIDTIAIVYMLVFLIMCLPASYIIDTFGIRVGVGIGAILAIIGVLIKGFGGSSLLLVFIGQFILAIAQPFILNAVTAFSARWFPLKERAIVAGLAALAQYIGILIVMIITPNLVVSSVKSPNYGAGIDSMLLIYMVPTIISGILILLFFKEKPKNLPFHIRSERLSFKKGLIHMVQIKDALLILVLFTIGLGIFNAVSSLVDSISANLKIEDSDGLIGGIMLVGGIIGAIIIPLLSDYFLKRKIFLVLCMAGVIPSIFGLSYAAEISSYFQLTVENTYNLALISSFILGMCIMSAGPIAFQYTAEITAPTPESTSQGVLLLVGQISGIIMVSLMSINHNAYLDTMMKAFVLMAIFAFILILFIKDSNLKST